MARRFRKILRKSVVWVAISLFGTTSTLLGVTPLAAQDEVDVFKVPKPAPGGRFSAVQGAYDKRQKRSKTSPEYMRGAGLFLDRCSSCHGEHGWGDGPWHTEFHPAPANLTLVNDTPAMLRSIVLNGVPNTMMPAFPDLDNATIDAIFDYIALQPRDLSNQWDHPWKLEQEMGEALKKPDLAAGRQSFVTWCVGCHGENGAGDGVMSRSEYIWPKPANFRARSSDVGRLYYIISNGRQGTFMAPQKEKLPERDRWRLAQYVASLYDVNQKATMRQSSGGIPVAVNPYPRADKEAAEYGRKRYDLWCAPCHASFARGSYLAPRLIDRQWKYGDGTDTAVWTVIKEGIPGKLMISFNELPEEERWKIITFIRSMGGLPDPLASSPKPSRQAKEPK